MDFDNANASQQSGSTIGNTVSVTFVTIGNKTVDGKVDTGATTSSLHAENISMDKSGSVSFVCPELSPNRISMALAGTQDVHSADGGGQARPMIKMDVEIDGHHIRDAVFNLNDRSNMDVMVLVGQNIIKAGGFLIDVSKDENPTATHESIEDAVGPDMELQAAIKLIASKNISLDEFVRLMYTASNTEE